MPVKPERRLVVVMAIVVALVLSMFGTAFGDDDDEDDDEDPRQNPPPLYTVDDYPPSDTDNVILKWDEELLQSVRLLPPGPTVVARAIAVLHTATFDAWAAYDARAKGTRLGTTLRQPVAEHTLENKNKAISFAAYAALVDLFPSRQANFAEQMTALGYAVDGSDTSTAAAVGTAAARAVLDYRHNDGANQLGGYADPCQPACYTPVNSGDTVSDRWRWQPLRVPLGTGPAQQALTPHWKNVTSFALTSPFQYRPPGPDRESNGTYGARQHRQIDDLLKLTSNLTERQKASAEYWADGPKSEFPPGHWALLAQVLSRKRGHSVDTDARMFFALGNALLDASIAAWAAKYQYDFVRPITAIRARYAGKTVTSWLGPYKGFGKVPGDQWLPYQAPSVVSPPFPEYVSGHSTFSAAGATILGLFTGSDNFGAKVTIKAGSSLFEPRDAAHPVGFPTTDITLSWATLTAAAKDAGMSRLYGGIHFANGNEHGYNLGRSVGYNSWAKTLSHTMASTAPAPTTTVPSATTTTRRPPDDDDD